MLVKEQILHIDDIELFQSLNTDQKAEINAIGVNNIIGKGKYVYEASDETDAVYIVLSGRIKVGNMDDGDKQIIKRIVYPGQLFGVQGLSDLQKRGEFALSITPGTRVFQIPIECIYGLIASNSNFALEMTKFLSRRLSKAEEKLEGFVFKSARHRIIDFLRQSAKKRGVQVGYETLVQNFLTHLEIANLTSTSRQTVTTVLNELRDKNMIYFDRKRFLIRDVEQLR